MKNSFRTKVVLTFLAEIFGCMMILIIACDLLLPPLFINNSKKSMEQYGNQVVRELERGGEHISELLAAINTAYMIRTTILDNTQQVLISENGDKMPSDSQSTQRMIERIEEFEKEEEGENAYFRERYDENDRMRRLFYIRKTDDGKYIIMNKAIKGIEQDAQLVSIFIMIMGLSACVIGGISWSFLTRPFTSQMKKMSRITREMSHLNFDEKIDYKSSDEIGVLADSIDELSEHLKTSIAELQGDVEQRKMLMRSLSHELKTPITTIRGYAENAQIVAGDNKKIQRYCSIMIEECDAIDRLVNGMLELSRIESSEYVCETEELRTSDLFGEVRMKVKMEFPDCDIRIRCEEGMITGNLLLLERAILNYIKNGVKYGKHGSTVWVDGYMEQNRFVIDVTNEGEEIPKEDRERIWDVFYKKDSSRKRDESHGIGLSIVQKVAWLHGGGVNLECENGKTVFSLWIPRERQ